jgi:replicative DNA helicase
MSATFSPPTLSVLSGQDEEVAKLRVPPHSIESEQSVLGGLLIDNSAWDRAGDVLVESDFYRYEHQSIYAAIGSLIAANKPADVITVFEQLQSLGKAADCGGLPYLNALAQSVTSAANLRRYAEIIRERAVLRKLIAASDEIATNAFNPQGRPVDQILDDAEGRIFKIGEEGSKSKQGFQSMDQLVVQLIDRVNELHENGAEEVTGVRTGFYDLDRMTAGLQPGDLIILAARPSMGKAQPLDAKVRTLTGWKRMGELQVGETLASVDGQPSTVTALFPQGEKAVYRVHFSDGRSAECCAEHLWRVHCRHWEQPRVLSTADLQALLEKTRYQNRVWIEQHQGEFGHQIPLPIDPWALGCLLGDGCLTETGDVHFSSASRSSALLERLSQRLAPNWVLSRAGRCDDGVGPPDGGKSPGAQAAAAHPLRLDLDALQRSGLVSAEKFVPRLYLEASREHRLDLLRGLLDTDGWVERSGTVRFATSSAQLAADVTELVRSLGGWCRNTPSQPQFKKANREEAQGLPSYLLHISHPEPQMLFTLAEKRDRTPKHQKRERRLNVLSVQLTRQAECQCIAVSHPSCLYITNDDVLTHNTAFALNIAENVAVSEGLPVVVFSMEMGAAQLALRVVGSLGRIDQSHLRTGKLVDDEWGRLSEAVERLGKVSLFIDETPGLSPTELRARARRQARQCGQLGLIVVDYLQLMSGSGGASEENRATVIGEISRGLKGLAKELKCPVIALSQLNRSVETRTDKRPMMSDLRESGAIEQDADVIMFIYRDDYYTKEACKEPGVAEIIIGKQRNGPVGTVKLAFVKPLTRFENLAPGSYGEDLY